MKRLLALVFITILISTLSAFAVTVTRGASEIHLTKHDLSPALRDIAPAPRSAGVLMVRENSGPPSVDHSIRPDQAWQSASLPMSVPAASGQFEGIGAGLSGYTVRWVPPDTNGDVGAGYYVQTVNTDLAVFDKTTGAVVLGPVAINTLWSGFGNACATRNDGDPIVVFDQVASRWLITQFTAKKPYLECVAVSQTSDPTGQWYRYSYSFANFPDYPKFAVWPSADAYFATYNMFQGKPFVGANVCAMKRSALISGAANTQQCVQLSSSYYSLLAADLDGTASPADPDEWVMSAYNGVKYWRFHLDWSNSANTTMTGPTSIGVASYTESCSGSSGSCVPQSGTTQKLDTLGVHLMHRLAYRVFSDHDSMVANHTVSVSGINAVRWYEFKLSGSPRVFSIAQQGTYSPDTTHRWMGSIGMDKNGNIAIGYSASSSSIHPEIRYTGHLTTDPAGQMETEATIIAGTGSQTGNRWGDYSSIQTDPADDCTFYYTTEYLNSGSNAWHTRIARIKLGSCP